MRGLPHELIDVSNMNYRSLEVEERVQIRGLETNSLALAPTVCSDIIIEE